MDNETQRQEKLNQAYTRRLKGWTYRQIGDDLGVSHVTARKWVTEHLSTETLPLIEEVRKQEYDRMMKILDKLEDRAQDGDDKALGLMLKVSERLCKMLGVDAPQQIQVEKHEVTEVDVAIRELISRQKAQNELRLAEAASLRSDDVSDEAIAERLNSDVESIVLED